MAQNGPAVPATALIQLLLLLHLCPSMALKIPKLCSGHVSYCNYNQSGMCGFEDTRSVSCTHQLQQYKLTPGMTAAECQMEKLFEDCGSWQPSHIYAHDKPLVKLSLYYYNTWMGPRAAVNFTFPSPDWNSLRFQYKVNNSNSRKGTYCTRFSLRGVRLPLATTLVYDCVVFRVPGNVSRDAEVLFENERGEGRTFTFRVPSHTRIHPLYTRLSEWHVFFYLHHDLIATSSHLPVTVQSAAPFPAVSYRVSIVKCLDAKSPDCGDYVALNSTLVAYPEEDEWTVHLPLWSNPGSYAVTVQIVSDECPAETGCRVSLSPKFEIKPSLLSIWISIGMGFFVISFLTFLLMLSQRLRTNKNILMALQDVQPLVLLVYLAENQPAMEFINIFADFLKDTCHLCPQLVDYEVANQDPNCWTRDHIISADKVLFLVPGNSHGESITPIRNQWIVALNYISGHHFTTRQMTKKVAAVVLPSSGNIPCEISHVCRFKLVEQVSSLVTWLHDGTWLDQVFLWRPTIRSLSEAKVSCTWSEVRDAAVRASSLTERVTETHVGISAIYRNIFLTSTNNRTTTVSDDVSTHSDDSSTTEEGSEGSSVFDPDIPSFDELQGDKGSKLSVYSENSYEIDSNDEDDDGIFT